MGLFDVPTSAAGGLFTPELQRAAALQGLFAMGNSIGAASQPSPTPGVNPFATAGIGATKAYDDFLKNALGMSLLQEQLQTSKDTRTDKERERQAYMNLPGMLQPGADPRQIGTQLLQTGVPSLATAGIGMLTKKPETFKVGAGETLLGPDYKPIFAAPDKPPEGFSRDPRGALVVDPNWFRTKLQLAQAGRPSVTVDNRKENAEAGAYGTRLVAEYTDISKRAESAQDSVALLQIAKNIDVKTGGAQAFAQPIAAFAKSLGVADETIKAFGANPPANAEAFIGTMENLVLAKMQSQAGPQTESDTKRIKATVAQLGNTNEAKEFLLRSADALAKRDMEKRAFYDAHRGVKNTFEGAGEAWRKYITATPLVAPNPKTGIPVFYEEFRNGMKKANPGASDDAIMSMWREKYGAK